MKATNDSNYPKKVDGIWFKPGETKEVNDISKERFSYHFTLEDDDTVETEEKVSEDDDDSEKNSKSETKNNEGDE